MTKLEIIKEVNAKKFTSDDCINIWTIAKDKTRKVNSFWGYQVNGNLIANFVEDNKDYKVCYGGYMEHGAYRTATKIEIYEQ